MQDNLVGLIDAGFINAAGRSLVSNPTLEYVPDEIVDWLGLAAARIGARMLRAYWYDGKYPESAEKYRQQQDRFAVLEACPGIQLRLGHLEARKFDFKPELRTALETLGVDYQKFWEAFNPGRHYVQKGVDTLIVLDMLRLVQQGGCHTIVLLAGDRDLAGAVRTVQQLGCTVILAYPEQAPVAEELRNLADEVVVWSSSLIEQLAEPWDKRFKRLALSGSGLRDLPNE